MDDLVKILTQHAKKYPLMEPVDAVKLIFQNEFGGGHLITGKEAGLNRLQEEYRNIIQSDDITLHEDIGNGIARINLSALDAYGLTIKKLNDIFVASSSIIQGSKESFIKKLNTLEKLTREGLFKFDSHSLHAYLEVYISIGCPPVSHSKIYRDTYKPAYRVVCKNLMQE
ncbi:MAG: hypothetical protein GX386_06120 [Clostridiaceae bacterium]|jgi:hypothetical protein|nr:hypothetical protein [Clostridiaceae bacterium]